MLCLLYYIQVINVYNLTTIQRKGPFECDHVLPALETYTLQSTGVEDQKLLCLVQDNFLTQHALEPTRATRILYIVLSSQKELVDSVEIKEPLGSSDHNQMHFDINIKSDKQKLNNVGGILGKVTIRKLGKV